MKVLALEVAGVRVYREFRRIEFSRGLNVVVGPNRAGKTSLADALAAALYGAERTRSGPLAKSDLKSWSRDEGADGGEFRTAVELEFRGERHRLERDLGAGKARLLAPGDGGWRVRTADAQAVAAAVKEMTGLDRADLFLATAYLRQGDLARVSKEENLVRMGELLRGIVSGVPEADLSEVLARLRAAQRDVKSEDLKGHRPANPREYDRLLQEREKVQRRVAESEDAFRLVLSLSERKADLEGKLPGEARRLEEVRAFLDRWRRKAALEKEMADANAEADALGRRLRRMREIRDELHRVQEGLGEIGDADGLIQAVAEKIPALRAGREAAQRRLDELRREVARLTAERDALREEVFGSGRLEVFHESARAIEEGLPLWEEALRRREEVLARAAGEFPSWGKIAFAFLLFALVFGTPLLYRAATGRLSPYLFAFFGLSFPVLLWAVLLLNRRLLRNFRVGAPPAQPEAGEAEPEEEMAALFRTLGVESAAEARAGLRRYRDALPGLRSAEELCRRAGREREEVERQARDLDADLQAVLRRFGVESEEALLRRHDRAGEILRRREDLMAREKELLAEGSEGEVADRLDEADRRRRDLRREMEEEGLGLFHPSAAELDEWRREEVSLAQRVEADRADLIRVRARLEEKAGGELLSPETLGERLQEIDERLRELDLLHRAYGVAVETLEEAARELEDSYLPRLQGTVEGHFRSLVGRDFGLDLTTGWPAVTVALPDNPRVDLRNLSCGTADQLYLSLRAASLEVLGGEEPLPLILDDPFVHYDDPSRQRGLEWLRRAAARTQVIFLAAREEYAGWAERTAGKGETRVLRLG